jgi:hypothetical protein
VRRRRRRRTVLVPLMVVGVATWAVRRRLGERQGLDDGWQPLPPRPVVPAAAVPPVAPAPPVPPPAPPVAAAAPPVAMPPAAPEPVEVPAAPRARAVPTATAVASVAAPARPAASAGPDVPGALPALADGSSPDPAYTVKGKVATKVFHAPGGAYYSRTRADVWFADADAARAAGFTERVRRHA